MIFRRVVKRGKKWYNRKKEGVDVLIWSIAAVTAIWICYLWIEARNVRRARQAIAHVVHVNGTRGKSTVSRLIEAGLRAGGVAVFCKTTGTDPMTIDVHGEEKPIIRRGKANIKEQIQIMMQAAQQGAQVLVVECMALQPELQTAAQHDILRADIGVMTNVRIDHTDVMGDTLPQIAKVLANTVPKNGILFTAEQGQADVLIQRAQQWRSEFHLVRPDGSEPNFDFQENIALALAVCQHLGVERDVALAGMAGFKRDPYALSLHSMGAGLFIGGLSINDIQSIQMVWNQLKEEHDLHDKRLTLLVNNRSDRGSRTEDMMKTCLAIKPQRVWLMGASQGYMRRKLQRGLPELEIEGVETVKSLKFDLLTQDDVVFAIGNIAEGGRELMTRVREEGENLV